MSDGRSLAGTSLAAETSLFCHCTDVYFWARQRFRSGLLYTLAVARFLESGDAAGTSARATFGLSGLEQGFWTVPTRQARCLATQGEWQAKDAHGLPSAG